MEPKTLRQILEEHPGWIDLPVGIYRSDGEIEYVGCSGMVYESEDEDGKILVFAGN